MYLPAFSEPSSSIEHMACSTSSSADDCIEADEAAFMHALDASDEVWSSCRGGHTVAKHS